MKSSMAKAIQTKVTVNIRPGRATPAQKQAWKRFWQKIIGEAQREVKHG